jgi:hypothetical protein
MFSLSAMLYGNYLNRLLPVFHCLNSTFFNLSFIRLFSFRISDSYSFSSWKLRFEDEVLLR